MLKKSCIGFVWWLLGFIVGMLALCFLPWQDEQMLIRLMMLMMTWYMAGLSFHIWRTEQIYWYNGTSYEEAEAAGPERRKVFAWKHFRLFGLFALLQTVLSGAMLLLGWSAWIDFAFATVGLIVTVFRTVPIKL